MATFIEEAKEFLTDEQFNRFELLRIKANNFESTVDEEEEFNDIKFNVRNAINQRDKDKNLSFLKDKSIQLVDVLRVMGSTREDINKAVKFLFPTKEELTESIATIVYKNKVGDEAETGVKMGTGDGVRLNRQASAEIQKLGVKGFVKNLTEFGRVWLTQNHVSEAGPFSGKTIYPNINALALRFKWKPADIKKALGIAIE